MARHPYHGCSFSSYSYTIGGVVTEYLYGLYVACVETYLAHQAVNQEGAVSCPEDMTLQALKE
jgi:hypothetical protein